jgi:hypothetical protein
MFKHSIYNLYSMYIYNLDNWCNDMYLLCINLNSLSFCNLCNIGLENNVIIIIIITRRWRWFITYWMTFNFGNNNTRQYVMLSSQNQPHLIKTVMSKCSKMNYCVYFLIKFCGNRHLRDLMHFSCYDNDEADLMPINGNQYKQGTSVIITIWIIQEK